jgi:hypothetical protein
MVEFGGFDLEHIGRAGIPRYPSRAVHGILSNRHPFRRFYSIMYMQYLACGGVVDNVGPLVSFRGGVGRRADVTRKQPLTPIPSRWWRK